MTYKCPICGFDKLPTCDAEGFVDGGLRVCANQAKVAKIEKLHAANDAKNSRWPMPRRYVHAALTDLVGRVPTRVYDLGHSEDYANGELMVFLGVYGTGKTHAACAIAKAFRARHRFAIFHNASMLADRLSYHNDPERTMMDDILTCDLLTLDDIGRDRGSPFERETLWKIISHRHAECLATIITTNLGPPAFEADELGTAVMSRVRGDHIFVFDRRHNGN